jgi:hypothetical protein
MHQKQGRKEREILCSDIICGISAHKSLVKLSHMGTSEFSDVRMSNLPNRDTREGQ